MTTRPTTSDQAPAMRLFHAAAATDGLAQLVRTLADGGDVELLRGAIDSGVLAGKGDGVPGTTADMALFTAVLPVLRRAPGPTAMQLVRDWRAAMGGVSDTSIQEGLYRQDPNFISALLALGADPNGPGVAGSSSHPSARVTALLSAYQRSLPVAVTAMLDALASRDVLPLAYVPAPSARARTTPTRLETLFPLLIREHPSNGYNVAEQIAEHLLETRIPTSWRQSIGATVLEFCAKRRFAGIYTDKHKSELLLLALAEIDSHGWKTVLVRGHTHTALPEAIAGPFFKDAALRLLVVRNILAAGVHPDDIASQTSDDAPVDSTMLHTAIHYGNAPMVELLLAHGADPRRRTEATVGYSDHPHANLDAFELAHRSQRGAKDDVLQLLRAWQARRAMDSVRRLLPVDEAR